MEQWWSVVFSSTPLKERPQPASLWSFAITLPITLSGDVPHPGSSLRSRCSTAKEGERRYGPSVRPPFLELATPPGGAAGGEGRGPRRASKDQQLATLRSEPRQPNPEARSVVIAHSAPHAIVDHQKIQGD